MARKRVTVKTLPQLKAKFGECGWSVVSSEVSWFPFWGTLRKMRDAVRDEIPKVPGVYMMLNEQGHVTYVGMSKRLSKRMVTYFSSTAKRRKESRIRRASVGFLWQPFPHPLLARLRERELIRRFRPAINIQGQPVRMKVGYIVATAQEAESFQIVNEVPRNHVGVWGPVPYHKFTRKAVEDLNLHFGLRDCPKQTEIVFKGEGNAPAAVPLTCMRNELNTCLAPCLGACSRSRYQQAFRKAKHFLEGQTEKVFEQIEKEMAAAAAERQFELAAKLRDRTKTLQYVDRHLRRFHDWSSQANFIYPVECELTEQTLWLVVVRGLLVDAIFEPTEKNEFQRAHELIESSMRQLGGNAPERHVSAPGDFEAARILYRWFQVEDDENEGVLPLKKVLKRLAIRKRKAS